MAEGGRGEGSRRHEATCLPAHRCVDVALSKAVFLSDHPAVQLQLRPPLHWNVETCRHQRSAVHFLDWSSGSYSSLSTMITVGGDCNQPPPPHGDMSEEVVLLLLVCCFTYVFCLCSRRGRRAVPSRSCAATCLSGGRRGCRNVCVALQALQIHKHRGNFSTLVSLLRMRLHLGSEHGS